MKNIVSENLKTKNKERKEIMKNYQIEMLDVGNADAFIISYEEDNGKQKLVLIDAGRYSDGEKIKNHLKKYYLNRTVDLAIVTHCDNDHFGGFIYLLENGCKINRFWINDPKMYEDNMDLSNCDDFDSVYFIDDKEDVDSDDPYSIDIDGETKNLIKLIEDKKIKHCEKFASEKTDADFPFFHILGPTKEYYEALLIESRFEELQSVNSETRKCLSEKSLSPALDDADDDTSSHNKSSIIFTFEPETGKKYLFMGDANREAFDKIPESLKKRYAKNVFWLKVPHHGSKHNLDSEMIEFIKPKVAYVSTAKINKYLSRPTVKALSEIGCELYSTHEKHTNFLHHGFDKRSGYSRAEPFTLEGDK